MSSQLVLDWTNVFANSLAQAYANEQVLHLLSVSGGGCVELTELCLIIECSCCTSELLYRVVPVRD